MISHVNDVTSGCDVLEIAVTAIFLFVFSITTIIIYYKKYSKLRNTYLEARNVVENIILSFNRQLKTDELLINQLRERVDSFKDYMDDVEEVKESVSAVNTDFDAKIKDLEKRIEELAKSYSDLKTKFERIYSERIQDFEKERIESAIPIKATTALEPLTETELLVLKILVNEGEKSSSQIKERINLTREHSARLLKKLYEEGYLERDMKNKPYKYRIKNEMANILKD